MRFIKIQQEQRVLYTKTFFTFITTSCWIFLRIRNVSNISCRENQNTNFMFIVLYPKMVPFMRQFRKIWRSQRRRKWQYGVALRPWLLRVQAHKHTPSQVHPHPHPCTHLHTGYLRVHTHTHTQICNTYFLSTATVFSQTHHKVTLYVRYLCCC